MSNNVTYNVHITGSHGSVISSAVVGADIIRPANLSSIEEAIKLGLEAIKDVNYGFIITDSRGVTYDSHGKQISGHKWTWWVEGTTGKARIFYDEESEAHKEVKEQFDAHPWLTECAYFVRPVPANTMVYEVTIGSRKKGTRHVIQRDKAPSITPPTSEIKYALWLNNDKVYYVNIETEKAAHEKAAAMALKHNPDKICIYSISPYKPDDLIGDCDIRYAVWMDSPDAHVINMAHAPRYALPAADTTGITRAEKYCWAVEFLAANMPTRLFETEVQADRYFKAYGSPHSVKKHIRLFEYQGCLVGPVKVEPASEDDLKEQATIDAKHQAIARARGLGLSDEELKAMGVEV